MNEFLKLIGTSINDAPQYMNDCYPVIDSDGLITGICAADSIDEDAILVWWHKDHAEETDGMHGFDAILE